MIKIKYNNRNAFEEVTFFRNGNLVTMTPTTPNPSGFTTWKLGQKDIISPLSRAYIIYK